MPHPSQLRRTSNLLADGALPEEFASGDGRSPGAVVAAEIVAAINEDRQSREEQDQEAYAHLLLTLADKVIADVGGNDSPLAHRQSTEILVGSARGQVAELLTRMQLTPNDFAADMDDAVATLRKFPRRLEAERLAATVRAPREIQSDIAAGTAQFEAVKKAWDSKRAALQGELDASNLAATNDRHFRAMGPALRGFKFSSVARSLIEERFAAFTAAQPAG